MKRSTYQKWNEKAADACLTIKNFGKRNKIPFIISLCAGLLVHFTLYSNGLLNPDAIWESEKYIAGKWEISLGRWASWILDCLHGGVNSYILMTFLTLVFFSLGGLLLNELFDVESPVARALVPLCVIVSPLVSVTITYYFCSDAYALAFALAIGAIFLAARGKGAASCVIGGVCLAFALGIYQSNLGLAVGLAVLVLLFTVVETPADHKTQGKLLLRLLVTGILGVGLYFLVLKTFLLVLDISMASYSGADAVGIGNILRNFPKSVHCAYQDFFTFFAGTGIMVNSYWVRPCYGFIFAVFFCLIVWKLIRNRAGILSMLCVAALLCLLPLCCNASDVAAPQTTIRLLTSAGMHCVCPAIIAFCSAQLQKNEDGQERNDKIIHGMRAIALGMGLLLTWNYIIVVNADSITMKNVTDQQIALTNRIWTRLEENEYYSNAPHETPVLMAGIPQNGNYPVASRFAENANEYAQLGMMWPTYDGSINCWVQMIRQKLGIFYYACSVDQAMEIFPTEEFKQMPIFPAQGSIQVIQGVVVVKLSEMGS